MSADAGGPDSDNPNIAMGKALLTAGEEFKKFMADKPALSEDPEINFIKVFEEVVSEVGLLFQNDVDLEKKLKQLLTPLASYTNLLHYFLLIKQILEGVKMAIDVDLKEHKDRLQWVNQELTRIAVQATAIAQNLEDLGNRLKDIIRGEESQKPANLKIFDIDYGRIHSRLVSCISDMERVKRKIDEGLSSIKGFTKTIRNITIGLGILAVVLAIFAPIAVGYYMMCTGCIAAYGALDAIGVAVVAGVLPGVGAPLVHWKGNKSAKEIKQCYLDQKYNWSTLDDKLKTMKEDMKILQEARKTA